MGRTRLILIELVVMGEYCLVNQETLILVKLMPLSQPISMTNQELY